MTIMRSKSGPLLLLAGMLVASLPGQTQAGEKPVCIKDWSVGAVVVKDNGLVSVAELTKRAKSKLSGKIVKTTLCNTNAGYAYMVVVRSPKGRMSTVRIDARHPFSGKTKVK